MRTRWALWDRADRLLDFDRVRPELLGELLEIGRGDLDETGLVDAAHHFHAHRYQLGLGLMLEIERLRGLLAVDLVGGGLHPLLLLGGEARPQLVADPHHAV